MTHLTLFNPSFRRLFADPFFGLPVGFGDGGENGAARWTPPVDVRDSDSEFRIDAELPGVSRENISVRFHDGRLVLEGRRGEPSGTEAADGSCGDGAASCAPPGCAPPGCAPPAAWTPPRARLGQVLALLRGAGQRGPLPDPRRVEGRGPDRRPLPEAREGAAAPDRGQRPLTGGKPGGPVLSPGPAPGSAAGPGAPDAAARGDALRGGDRSPRKSPARDRGATRSVRLAFLAGNDPAALDHLFVVVAPIEDVPGLGALLDRPALAVDLCGGRSGRSARRLRAPR